MILISLFTNVRSGSVTESMVVLLLVVLVLVVVAAGGGSGEHWLISKSVTSTSTDSTLLKLRIFEGGNETVYCVLYIICCIRSSEHHTSITKENIGVSI